MSDTDPRLGVATCTRCVLSADVPGVTLDEEGVCNVCHQYAQCKEQYGAYFKTDGDLATLIATIGRRTGTPVDCLLLYSGGRDSTYVLYRLVELGCRVLALTFDNGYIPASCFDNIRRVCDSVRVESLVVGVPDRKMDQVFVESLRQDGTVCTGCFRGLTARSTEVAIERGIPLVVTGLSRGQMFATKVHALFRAGVTDIASIEAHLAEFRSHYHAARDTIASLIGDRVLEHEDELESIEFVDFYRYSPVTKREIVQMLNERAPFWRKPTHVGGCSTNCLINDVGIHVHLQTRGYHNYAIPLAWDVRFGHLTREDAQRQLWEGREPEKVTRLLRMIGYQ